MSRPSAGGRGRAAARNAFCILIAVAPVVLSGCRSAHRVVLTDVERADVGIRTTQQSGPTGGADQRPNDSGALRLASHSVNRAETVGQEPAAIAPQSAPRSATAVRGAGDDLRSLEGIAESSSPELRRLQQQTAAAWARVRYIDELPDPTIGTNIFGHPIETAAGSQRANVTVMQMIPWLERLDAQEQQACFEALAMQQLYEAERLRVRADLRTRWAQLYVLNQQLMIIERNRTLLEALTTLVTSRLAQNQGSAGDTTLLTVSLGRLEEEKLSAQQQITSIQAEMNQLMGRAADLPISAPAELPDETLTIDHAALRQTAWQHQPEIVAATLRTQASRWGLEVARLKRRPDLSLSASWFAIEGNRPPSGIVDVGQDAWSLGAQMSIPLGTRKYDAIRDEAAWSHSASTATVENLRWRYDAMLRDQMAQAAAAAETAALYQSTILPQAQQTLAADQQSLANGTVDLARVLEDTRSLLVLELGYHRARAQQAIAIARIRQAVGMDLEFPPAGL